MQKGATMYLYSMILTSPKAHNTSIHYEIKFACVINACFRVKTVGDINCEDHWHIATFVKD